MNDTFSGMTRHDIAESLGVTVSAVRLYEREFGRWMKAEKGEFGRGRAKTYGREDVNLFRFVRSQAKAGHSFDEIRQVLMESGGVPPFSEIVDEDVFAAASGQPGGETAGQNQLVPMNQYVAVVARMAAAEGERRAISEQVEYLRGRVAELERQVVENAERAAVAETKAAVLAAAGGQPSWWKRVLGRGSTPPAENE